jgi:hypothetical protein
MRNEDKVVRRFLTCGLVRPNYGQVPRTDVDHIVKNSKAVLLTRQIALEIFEENLRGLRQFIDVMPRFG